MFESECSIQSQGFPITGHGSNGKSFLFLDRKICRSDCDFISNVPCDCRNQGDLVVTGIGCFFQECPGSSNIFSMEVKATIYSYRRKSSINMVMIESHMYNTEIFTIHKGKCVPIVNFHTELSNYRKEKLKTKTFRFLARGCAYLLPWIRPVARS